MDNNKRKLVVRVVCIVLASLMVLGTVSMVIPFLAL